VTRLIICIYIYIYMRHDSFLCVMFLIHTCDMMITPQRGRSPSKNKCAYKKGECVYICTDVYLLMDYNKCVGVYVYVYVFICVCIHIYIYMYIDIYMYTCICVYTCA